MPKSGTKYGQYGQKFIYAVRWSTTVIQFIFTKLTLTQQLFVINSYIELNKNLTNGLVADTNLLTDRQTAGCGLHTENVNNS
jgi:hypothetical protein